MGIKKCAPKLSIFDNVDDPEMCNSIKHELEAQTCSLILAIRLDKDFESIISSVRNDPEVSRSYNAMGPNSAYGFAGNFRRLETQPDDNFSPVLERCMGDIRNFHNNPDVTSRDQFAYKIPDEESCSNRLNEIQTVNQKLSKAIIDSRLSKYKSFSKDCNVAMAEIDRVLSILHDGHQNVEQHLNAQLVK